jgi:hypothetical protein
MSYSELQRKADAWSRADASTEVARTAEALARELAERLGWNVKVEINARLGGQMACAAVRAKPRDEL